VHSSGGRPRADNRCGHGDSASPRFGDELAYCTDTAFDEATSALAASRHVNPLGGSEDILAEARGAFGNTIPGSDLLELL
jgi:hypothetical protein